MLINVNWIVAIAGCAVLFLFWRWQSASGMRGFLFLLLGVSVILGAVIYQQEASRLPNLVGLLLAFFFLALLLFCLGKLAFTRQHPAPQYQAPDQLRGRCSRCAQVAPLKHYEQGWLCAGCARRRDAKAA